MKVTKGHGVIIKTLAHTDQQENHPEATGTMQQAVMEHDADAESVTRTPSKRTSLHRKYEEPVPELSYSDDPYDSLSSANSSFESLDRPTTPPPYHALVRYVPSSKKCDQPTPVTPVRNHGPTKVKKKKATPYTPSRGRVPTKQPVTPGKNQTRTSFQAWVEGSEAGEFIPMTHRFMKRSERLTEEQLFEREYRLLMQAKERRDNSLMKPLDSEDWMELPQTPPKAKNQKVVVSGSGSESDAMDISPRKPLSRQDTEIIDHDTFRGGAPPLPVIPSEWIKNPSNALRSHPTEILPEESC